MRFHFDDHEADGPPDPFDPSPRPATLDHDERVEFLRLLHEGLGRTMACSQLGIGPSILRRTMARNSAFRRAVEHVEQVRADNLFTGLYVAALNGDTRAAMFLLSRRDGEAGRGGGRRDRPR